MAGLKPKCQVLFQGLLIGSQGHLLFRPYHLPPPPENLSDCPKVPSPSSMGGGGEGAGSEIERNIDQPRLIAALA